MQVSPLKLCMVLFFLLWPPQRGSFRKGLELVCGFSFLFPIIILFFPFFSRALLLPRFPSFHSLKQQGCPPTKTKGVCFCSFFFETFSHVALLSLLSSATRRQIPAFVPGFSVALRSSAGIHRNHPNSGPGACRSVNRRTQRGPLSFFCSFPAFCLCWEEKRASQALFSSPTTTRNLLVVFRNQTIASHSSFVSKLFVDKNSPSNYQLCAFNRAVICSIFSFSRSLTICFLLPENSRDTARRMQSVP